MISVLNGSPHTEKQINILTYLLGKIKVEQYTNSKMEEILNLFVVLYLKCKREVQITFLDDIDKIFVLLQEEKTKQQVFVDKTFKFKIAFQGVY